MKQLYNLDIILLVLITIMSLTCILIPTWDNLPLKAFPCILLLFILPGYSLINALYPDKENHGFIKRLLSGLVISVVIVLIFYLLNYISFKIHSKSVFIILAGVTVLFALITLIRRKKSGKKPQKIEYIICKKCKGHYRLKHGESLDDFVKCSCGGELKYIKSDYIPKKESKKKLKQPQTQKKSTKVKSDPKIHLKSPFLLSDISVIFLVVLSYIIFVLTLNINETPVKIILEFLFMLFLPGYSLISALFPKKKHLDLVERLALSFGFSVTLTFLIGLLLNYTSFGIGLTSILIFLSIFTILMCIIAYIRRLKLQNEKRFAPNFNLSKIKKFGGEYRLYKILSAVLIISLILTISMTVYAITTAKQSEKFSEFYILGPDGKASDYPTNLTAGQSGNVTIGIVNHEYSKTNYLLIIQMNNKTLKDENITLSSGEKYEKPFIFTAPSGNKQKLEFLLYKLPDNSTVYRSLHLWINTG